MAYGAEVGAPSQGLRGSTIAGGAAAVPNRTIGRIATVALDLSHLPGRCLSSSSSTLPPKLPPQRWRCRCLCPPSRPRAQSSTLRWEARIPQRVPASTPRE